MSGNNNNGAAPRELNFEEAIEAWAKLDEDCSKHNQALRQIRTQRSSLMANLVKHMSQTGQTATAFKTPTGVVSMAKDTTYSSFTQKFVMEGLRTFFEAECGAEADVAQERADRCMTFLKSRREVTEQFVLRRVADS